MGSSKGVNWEHLYIYCSSAAILQPFWLPSDFLGEEWEQTKEPERQYDTDEPVELTTKDVVFHTNCINASRKRWANGANTT